VPIKKHIAWCYEKEVFTSKLVSLRRFNVNFMAILAEIADPGQEGIFRLRGIVSFPFDPV
jgi:hypothetical protein